MVQPKEAVIAVKLDTKQAEEDASRLDAKLEDERRRREDRAEREEQQRETANANQEASEDRGRRSRVPEAQKGRFAKIAALTAAVTAIGREVVDVLAPSLSASIQELIDGIPLLSDDTKNDLKQSATERIAQGRNTIITGLNAAPAALLSVDQTKEFLFASAVLGELPSAETVGRQFANFFQITLAQKSLQDRIRANITEDVVQSVIKKGQEFLSR